MDTIVTYINPDFPNIIYPEYVRLGEKNNSCESFYTSHSVYFSQYIGIQSSNKYRPGFCINGLLASGLLPSDLRIYPEVLFFIKGTGTTHNRVDYYLPDYNTIIELDGGYHEDCSDAIRDKYFKELGIRVCRITEADWDDPSWVVKEFMKIINNLGEKQIPIIIEYSINKPRIAKAYDKWCEDKTDSDRLTALLSRSMKGRLDKLSSIYPEILEYLNTDRSTPLNLGWISTRELVEVLGLINAGSIPDYLPTIKYLAELNIILKPYSYRGKFPKIRNITDGRVFEIFESEVNEYLKGDWVIYKCKTLSDYQDAPITLD